LTNKIINFTIKLLVTVDLQENSGLREASYKTWEFDSGSIPRLTVLLFVPAVMIYIFMEDEVVL